MTLKLTNQQPFITEKICNLSILIFLNVRFVNLKKMMPFHSLQTNVFCKSTDYKLKKNLSTSHTEHSKVSGHSSRWNGDPEYNRQSRYQWFITHFSPLKASWVKLILRKNSRKLHNRVPLVLDIGDGKHAETKQIVCHYDDSDHSLWSTIYMYIHYHSHYQKCVCLCVNSITFLAI